MRIWLVKVYEMQPLQDLYFFLFRWGCFPPDGLRGRCYVHMLNAACLSSFSVPCHRYHLTQELFGGQLFQAIESRSKPAPCVFLWLSVRLPVFSLQSVPHCFWNWEGSQILTAALHYKPQTWPALSRRKVLQEYDSMCVCVFRFCCKISGGKGKQKRKHSSPQGSTYNWETFFASCVNNPHSDVITDKSCVLLRIIFKLVAPFRKDFQAQIRSCISMSDLDRLVIPNILHQHHQLHGFSLEDGVYNVIKN